MSRNVGGIAWLARVGKAFLAVGWRKKTLPELQHHVTRRSASSDMPRRASSLRFHVFHWHIFLFSVFLRRINYQQGRFYIALMFSFLICDPGCRGIKRICRNSESLIITRMVREVFFFRVVSDDQLDTNAIEASKCAVLICFHRISRDW